jgi:6-pyruvoyltetrahydropterin/6-carboxytetrahydropterin synthase
MSARDQGDGAQPRKTMLETFKQFTFEAAHQTPPFSSLHGHSFTVCVYMRGRPDPSYGWSHNLDDVELAIDLVKKKVDHKYLNDVRGLEIPTLENVSFWLFNELSAVVPGVDRIMVRRGLEGTAEGCTVTATKEQLAA